MSDIVFSDFCHNEVCVLHAIAVLILHLTPMPCIDDKRPIYTD